MMGFRLNTSIRLAERIMSIHAGLIRPGVTARSHVTCPGPGNTDSI